jgi:hypothetical protein
VDDLEVIILQFLVPLSYSPCQLVGGFLVHEILVVRFNDKGVFGSDQVGLPVVDCFHDSEKLQIVGIIVLFCWHESGRVEGNGVSLSRGCCFLPFILQQHSSYPILGGVGLEVEGFVEVGLLQD